MNIFSTISSVTSFLKGKKDQGLSIGFVPTMGALHEGHLSLMRQAKKENDILVVSIFVNPIQFNNPEDLKKYPRDIEKDRNLIEQLGCDVLFAPEVEEMYPEPETKVYSFGPLEDVMEGASRKGHFNGVGIVVKKLFDIITPDKAYFGEKDFQQLAVIKKLVEIEKMPVDIVPSVTVREKDGLAMSSRNERLTAPEREIAPFIYRSLQMAKEKFSSLNPGEIRLFINNLYQDQREMKLEYFEIADDKELQPIDNWNYADGAIGFIVVHLGKVRLIDNIRFY